MGTIQFDGLQQPWSSFPYFCGSYVQQYQIPAYVLHAAGPWIQARTSVLPPWRHEPRPVDNYFGKAPCTCSETEGKATYNIMDHLTSQPLDLFEKRALPDPPGHEYLVMSPLPEHYDIGPLRKDDRGGLNDMDWIKWSDTELSSAYIACGMQPDEFVHRLFTSVEELVAGGHFTKMMAIRSAELPSMKETLDHVPIMRRTVRLGDWWCERRTMWMNNTLSEHNPEL